MIRRTAQEVDSLRTQCSEYLFGRDGNSPTKAYDDLRRRSLAFFGGLGSASASAEDFFQLAMSKTMNGALATYMYGDIGGDLSDGVDTDFRKWFLTLVGNLARDHYRWRKVRREVSLNAPTVSSEGGMEDGFLIENIPVDSHEIKDGLDLETVVHSALQLFQDLPERLGSVFYLVISGFSYNEIAEALDIPIGTVKSRLNKLRGDLQARLMERHPGVREFL